MESHHFHQSPRSVGAVPNRVLVGCTRSWRAPLGKCVMNPAAHKEGTEYIYSLLAILFLHYLSMRVVYFYLWCVKMVFLHRQFSRKNPSFKEKSRFLPRAKNRCWGLVFLQVCLICWMWNNLLNRYGNTCFKFSQKLGIYKKLFWLIQSAKTRYSGHHLTIM